MSVPGDRRCGRSVEDFERIERAVAVSCQFCPECGRQRRGYRGIRVHAFESSGRQLIGVDPPSTPLSEDGQAHQGLILGVAEARKLAADLVVEADIAEGKAAQP